MPAARKILLSTTPWGPACSLGQVSIPQTHPSQASLRTREAVVPRGGLWQGRDLSPASGESRRGQGKGKGLLSVLTTNLLFTFSRICFSLRAMDSPFRFLIRFFSSFLQAYILPVARTWQAHTCSQGRWGKWGPAVPFLGVQGLKGGRGLSGSTLPHLCTLLGSGLATHLPKATFAQDSVLPEGVFGHWLPVDKGLGIKH